MSRTNRLVISEQALEDLVDIWQYIALAAVDNADRFVDLIYHKCSELTSMPEMGRKRDELIPGIRSFPVKRYVILYRIRKDLFEIIIVLNAYRDLSSVF